MQYSTTAPRWAANSKVLLPAREKSDIDWKTVDRIADLNPDFKEFVSCVAKSVEINQPAVNGPAGKVNFDRLLTDQELAVHLKEKKMLDGSSPLGAAG